MEVSLLIVNWNTRDWLRQCLGSIRETAGGIPHEVIVVDNASEDGSAEMVREEYPDVRLHASSENEGFAKGINTAYAISSGRYVLVMNPDITLLEGTIEGLIRFADAHPDAGMISPKLLNPDRTLQQKYYGRIPTLLTLFFLYTPLGIYLDSRLFGNRIRKRERYEIYGDFQEPLCFADGGAAFCCTLIPRRLIEQNGFMDERFPVFFNDGDFGFRVFRSGYKAYIIPEAQACHYGGASIEQLDQIKYNKEYIYGMRAFYRKHRSWLYCRTVDSLLSLNLLYDLSKEGRSVLRGEKRFRDLLSLVRRFRELLSYCPPSAARPKQGRTRKDLFAFFA